MMDRVFVWKGHPNYGDAMGVWLARKAFGKELRTATAAESPKLVGLGSVLWAALPGDEVWGTGVHPRQFDPSDVIGAWTPERLTILSVRGPITRGFLIERGHDCPEHYGDPALLLPKFWRDGVPAKTVDVGAVTHYSDGATLPGGVEWIHAGTDYWRTVVRRILACRKILSSSLHGIIVAEAFRIPAVWVRCGEGEAKFRDYYLSTGRDVSPVDWHDAVDAAPPRLPSPT